MITILVVDDSPVIQRLLGHILRANGYAVHMAANGNDALALLRDQVIDIAIIDLAMPEMDGLTLLRLIRADPHMHRVGLVMLTASGLDQDRIAAQEAGVNEFLTKPTSSRDLLATVERLLEQHPGQFVEI